MSYHFQGEQRCGGPRNTREFVTAAGSSRRRLNFYGHFRRSRRTVDIKQPDGSTVKLLWSVVKHFLRRRKGAR